MKKSIILIIVLLFLSLATKAQVTIFTAGMINSGVDYIDMADDTLFSDPVSVDLDHNYQTDLIFTRFFNQYPGGVMDYLRVQPQNGCKIATRNILVCEWSVNYNLSRVFQLGDTINDTSVVFKDTTAYIGYYSWSAAISCDAYRWDHLNNTYIGFTIPDSNSVLHGWMRLGEYWYPSGNRIILLDYCINKQDTLVEVEYPNYGDIHLLPNPAHESFTILYSSLPKEFNMTVYDITGNVIIDQTLPNTHTEINISGLSEGVYFVKLTGNNLNTIKKLVKY